MEVVYNLLPSGLHTFVSSIYLQKEFLFSICFISLSTNLKLSIDIFIMSKLIKHTMISSLSAAGR